MEKSILRRGPGYCRKKLPFSYAESFQLEVVVKGFSCKAEKAEDLCVSLLKQLSEAKANFGNGAMYLSGFILTATLSDLFRWDT